MFKVDLHTHSDFSHDGGITQQQYMKALEKNVLDYIAVTDHNSIDFATRLKSQLGDQIIVGEEIMSSAGEIIGLYLSKPIMPGLTPSETIRQIKSQNGLVYIPHPFETIRKGMHPSIMEELLDSIDIVEVCNGRAFLQNRSQQAVVWSKLNDVVTAASSDAHGYRGLGKTYTILDSAPVQSSLKELLATGKLITDRPSIRALLYPKYHKIRRKIRRSS